ncbi:hypothetical protein C2U71_04600 [Burkholderia ubonensis]|nr:hypothetical protein C2U71_04600 [Burkholderia ubonensis]
MQRGGQHRRYAGGHGGRQQMATQRGKRCGRHRSASPFLKWKVNMPRAPARRLSSGRTRSCGVAHLKGPMYREFVRYVCVCSRVPRGAVKARSRRG